MKVRLGVLAFVVAGVSMAGCDAGATGTPGAAQADAASSSTTPTADPTADAAPPTTAPGPTPPAPSATPTAAAPTDVASPAAAVPVVGAEQLTLRTATYDVDAELPVVGGVEPAVAGAVSAHLRAWYDEQLTRFAEEDRDFVIPGTSPEDFPPGLLQIRTATGAVDPHLLSVVLTVTAMHQGMAHPWTVIETFTYDLATGRVLALTDLFAPGQDVLATISAEVVPRLVAQLDPSKEGWAEAGVREGAGPDAASLARFAVDEAGLTLHFDQYQVAPGAAGTRTVTLAWDELLDLLEPGPLLRAALDG